MKTLDPFYDKMPTRESYDLFLKSYNEANERMKEASNYRMANYFNCIDDYSWGGLCDKAADEAYNKRNRLRRNLEIELKEGAFIETIELAILCDMDGVRVSCNIVKGKFGYCWLINNGNNTSFIRLAKKQATYNKKGYKVMTLSLKSEYYYTTGGRVVSRILSETITDSMPEIQTTYKPDFIFFSN